MSIQSHVLELKRRHAAIDQELSRELARPSANPYRLAELKRKKLVLKDEITRLDPNTTVH